MSGKQTKKKRKVYRKMYEEEIRRIKQWPLRYRLKVIWQIFRG